MAGVTLFEGWIGDVAGSISITVEQDFAGDFPFTISFDGEAWELSLDDASRLASAGRRIEYRLDYAARRGVAPKAEPFFRRKIFFGDEMVIFELGVGVEPPAVYLEWGGKRVPGEALLFVLARLGDAADSILSAARRP